MLQKPLTFLSSINDDVWHKQTGEGAFECWTFDAMSDDGREVVSIKFYDNFILSPRYVSQPLLRFPAVTFVYCVDGKKIYHKVVEYPAESVQSDGETAAMSIGKNTFRIDKADYGSGYMVKLDLPSRGGRRIEVSLEWLSVDADMLEASGQSVTAWNVAAPRSDVSGRITLIGRRGQEKKTCHFRGTGSHEQFRSNRSIVDTFATRQWGHAHFIDTTAFFCRQTVAVGEQVERLYIIRDGKIEEYDAVFNQKSLVRSRYGARYPQTLTATTDCGINLEVRPATVIDTGFSNVKLVSKMTLELNDGKVRTTDGVAEFLTTARMNNGLFRFLTGLGIKRN